MYPLKNNFLNVLLILFINLIWAFFFYTSYAAIPAILILIIYGIASISMYVSQKKSKAEKAILNQHKEYKKEIQKIYKNTFKNTSHEAIFDTKIFTIIDMIIDLTNKNTKGVFLSRVHSLINESLRVYIVNLDSASHMVSASEVDIDFKSDINELMLQNINIIATLREFINKLVKLNLSDKDYSNLLDSFSNTLLNLDTIKTMRMEK